MTRRCTTCHEEDVLAWVLGDPDADAARKLAERMAACPVCRERAVEYRILHRTAEGLRDGPVIRWRRFDSPFGAMRVAGSPAGLVALAHGRTRATARSSPVSSAGIRRRQWCATPTGSRPRKRS